MLAHVESIQASPELSRILHSHNLSADEFVVLTVLVGMGLMALQMQDSLGEASTAFRVDPRLVTFFREHRQELATLDSMMAINQ